MEEQIVQKFLSMTGIVKYMNENFGSKKTGNKFTTSDIQQYIRRGIPNYITDIKIVPVNAKYSKLYNLVKITFDNKKVNEIS